MGRGAREKERGGREREDGRGGKTRGEKSSKSVPTKCLYFLADRTNGRAYTTVLRLSVCRRLSVCLSVTLCIVAKRCVLEQTLLLRAYRKSYMRNRLVPK